MSLYRETTKVGSNAYFNGTKLQNVYLNNTKVWSGRQLLSKLPEKIRKPRLINYRGELHIIAYFATSGCSHFKWNGTSWVVASTLPITWGQNENPLICAGYDDYIYILEESDPGNYKRLFRWDGSSWSNVGALPAHLNYSFDGFSFDNNLYAVGEWKEYSSMDPSRRMYAYNGTAWTFKNYYRENFANILPCNGKIYLLGSAYSSNANKFYCYSNNSWSSLPDLPFNDPDIGAVAYHDELHVFGGYYSSYRHYKWNGESWAQLNNLPYSNQRGKGIEWNGDIVIAYGFSYSSYGDLIIQWDESTDTWLVGT